MTRILLKLEQEFLCTWHSWWWLMGSLESSIARTFGEVIYLKLVAILDLWWRHFRSPFRNLFYQDDNRKWRHKSKMAASLRLIPPRNVQTILLGSNQSFFREQYARIYTPFHCIGIALDTLRPSQNGHRLLDDIFKCIFLTDSWYFDIQISLKCVPIDPVSNGSTFVQIMARCRTGDEPLSEPLRLSFADAYIRHSASIS